MMFSSHSILGIFLGATAGLGLLLVLSVWLWPRSQRTTPSSSGSQLQRRISETAVQLGMKPAVLVALSLVLGLIGAAVGWAVTGVIALSCVLFLACAAAPWFFASARKTAAHRQLRNQWPDVVDALISAIRSGANIPDAVMSLAAFSSTSISTPVARFAQDYRSTGNFLLAATDLKARWANPNGDRIIETLQLGRELGGTEITTVLGALGSHLRAESALRQEVEARQGWIRLAARIGVMAPWIVLVLLSSRPEAAQAYNSATGMVIIALGFVVSIVAYKIMSAVGYFPEEKRWLA
jgi:tight adherence protein B